MPVARTLYIAVRLSAIVPVHGSLDSNAYTVIGQTMTGLVGLPGANEIRPGLAERWRLLPMGKSYVLPEGCEVV